MPTVAGQSRDTSPVKVNVAPVHHDKPTPGYWTIETEHVSNSANGRLDVWESGALQVWCVPVQSLWLTASRQGLVTRGLTGY